MKSPFVAAVALVLMLGAPTLADAQRLKPSKGEQVRLGQNAAKDVRKQLKVLPSTDVRVRTLRRVANRILSAMKDTNDPWEYTFDVVDDRQVNAFALPGGPIFFYTGLMDLFTTEDELAGVVAHEIVHIKREHWAYAFERNQTRQLGLALLLGITRANRTITSAVGLVDTLGFTLPYSRAHETQADDQGMDLMVAAGYNPEGMVSTFRLLQQASSGGRPPEFFSTHPTDRNRIRRLEDRLKLYPGPFPPQRPLNLPKSDEKENSKADSKSASGLTLNLPLITCACHR